MSIPEKALTGAQKALLGLKDFQRQTVDYVFDRLYAKEGSGRFLVADEVGLGKTMIAKGVIARSIEYLRDKVDRIDVVYICSNGDIARQNIDRLRVEGEHIAFASRLTLLPTRARELEKQKGGVNFISFTPGTSFDVASGFGLRDERVLIHAMLRELWDFGNAAAPMNVLRGNVGADRFRGAVDEFNLAKFDPGNESTKRFGNVIQQARIADKAEKRQDIRARFEALCEHYPTYKSDPGPEVARERSQVVGKLRSMLAQSCIDALEPDLIVLDEFQRFSHLLDGEDDASLLARDLFEYEDKKANIPARVLLLSATPYKMYTQADEAAGEDHYRDFVRTLRFLERAKPEDKSLEDLLERYRRALLDAGESEDMARLADARRDLENRLRHVMVRTERLAATPDRNGMLSEVRAVTSPPTTNDALGYLALQKLAKHFDHYDTLEYWKSAPYVLNFMDGDYKLKRELDEAIEDSRQRFDIAKALSSAPNATIPFDAVEARAGIDLANARMRALVDDTIGKGAHELLWVPPSLPYYAPAGAFAKPELQGFTKRLVFSSWRFVPRAVAALVSYEAERRMDPKGKARGRRLTFARGRDKRLTGMPVLALMYPCVYLAKACDPAFLAGEVRRSGLAGAGSISAAQMVSEAKQQMEFALRRLPASAETGPVDERWYWAAPLLLDAKLEPEATKRWFEAASLADRWARRDTAEGEEATAEEGAEDHELWDDHVEQAREVALGKHEPLGRRPPDLAEVLAELALGAPGTTMLRAMLRVSRMRADALGKDAGAPVRDGAAQAAWHFRTLFNQPEITAMVERTARTPDAPYWRQVLQYGVDGCLQSVLDEYTHVLRDHLGAFSEEDRAPKIAEQIAEALSLKTATLRIDDIAVSEAGRTVFRNPKPMRSHFALRFGDEKTDDGRFATRADSVRKAFNSPFWPFVVATTSVGQEGLDFHTYCHAVMHWNLPTNPVDLEQREGRVHRYKNHAVRKNVAKVHGEGALSEDAVELWEAMFEKAKAARAKDATDIVPYWVFCPEGGAKIERHVGAMPLSREREQMARLSASLAVYRMVFGQPRQDDLLKHLVSRMGGRGIEEIVAMARVKLGPRVHSTPN